MRPVPVLPDYLVKLVIPASRAILKPAVIYRFVSLVGGPLGREITAGTCSLLGNEGTPPENLFRKIARFFVSNY